MMIFQRSWISFSEARGQYPTSDTWFERYWPIYHPPSRMSLDFFSSLRYSTSKSW